MSTEPLPFIRRLAAFARVRPAIAAPPADPARLAASIRAERRRAIALGVRPLPASVHRALLGFFPADLLQRTRFAVGGRSLPALAHGSARAVTLADVVLLRAGADPQAAEPWVPELARVAQFQRWGIEGFADRCSQDGNAMQQEAAQTARRFAAWQHRPAA